MGGLFSGLTVIDLTDGIAGPIATMMLADHGADVVKIEPPGGDPFRDQDGYRGWQRGKRSAVRNPKQHSATSACSSQDTACSAVDAL